jgi:hypothetical protein
MEAFHDLLPLMISFINKLTPVPNARQICHQRWRRLLLGLLSLQPSYSGLDTTIEFWYSIPTIIILIGIQSGHNYCRNTVVPIYLRLMRVNARIQSEYKPKAPIVKLIMTS